MTSEPDAFTLPKNSKQNWDYRITAWSVLWSDKSKKQLKKLDKKIAGRIIDGVEDIKGDPYLAVRRLAGSKFFRLRIGDYRVILDLQQGNLLVFVITTDNRKKIYKSVT